MNEKLKKIVQLIAKKHNMPFETMLKKCNRLCDLANSGNAPVIFSILQNEPPAWLRELFLFDSHIDLTTGTPIYGGLISSLLVSKAFENILFCYALKSNRNNIAHDHNIASLRDAIIDDSFFSDFLEDIFPCLHPECKISGNLNKTRILSLDKNAISFFKRFKGSLFLERKDLFNPQVIKILKDNFNGKLNISDIPSLSMNEFKQLVLLDRYTFLPETRDVHDDVIIPLLEQFKGKLGIKNDDIRKTASPSNPPDLKLLALMKSGQNSISLPSEMRLSASVAKLLAKTRKTLDFRTIATINPTVVTALESHQGTLILDGVKSLEFSEELSLSRHVGRVRLRDIHEIKTPELAKKLVESAECEGQLQLYVTSLIPAVAWELAKFKGPLLLDGIKSLDDDNAKVLASHCGYLRLNEISSISERAADWLLDKDGDTSFKNLRNEFYPKLTNIKVTNIFVLAFRHELLPLNHLKTLDKDTKEILIKHQGGIQLNNLENVEKDTIVDFLSRYRGKSIQIKLVDPDSTGQNPKVIFEIKKENEKLQFKKHEGATR